MATPSFAMRVEEARPGRGQDRASVIDADGATWLAQRDVDLAATGTGMAAAIVLSISDGGDVRGASVGDCEAWVFGDGAPTNLTSQQIRKPRLGDGAAVPTSFVAAGQRGTLVIATDGLWKYLNHRRIAELARTRPLDAAVAALVDGVRLRSGALQDDVAIVLCALRDS